MENFFPPGFYINANLIIRTILGVTMLSFFLKVCGMNSFWHVLISSFINIGVFIEMILITKKGNEPLSISPWLIALLYTTIFIYKNIPNIIIFHPERKTLARLNSIRSSAFAFYLIGFAFTIISFRSEKLVSQLILFAVIHLAAFVCNMAAVLSIRNMGHGKFFYAYPALLVISNDIFAYFIGKAIGKTPLITLSPNKTVEGFIGAFIFTLIVGFILSYLKVKGHFLSDKFDQRMNEPLKIWCLSLPCIYFHNIVFVFAASFCAPFSGFLASAVKRAFGKKDFGALIPGHGGITDRFDCQLLMVFFTHYYIKGAIFFDGSFVNVAYNFFIKNMKDSEIHTLQKMLSTHLARHQGINN